jgi:hypothetical protein
MLRPLLKVTFFAWVWQNYRHLIGSTLVLFVAFWLTNKVHQDYLSYLSLKGSDEGVGLSFVIKWLVIFCSIILYFLFNSYLSKRLNKSKSGNPRSGWFKKTSNDSETPERRKGKRLQAKEDSAEDSANDPFANFRGTQKLRSRAEIAIEENTPDAKPENE